LNKPVKKEWKTSSKPGKQDKPELGEKPEKAEKPKSAEKPVLAKKADKADKKKNKLPPPKDLSGNYENRIA